MSFDSVATTAAVAAAAAAVFLLFTSTIAFSSRSSHLNSFLLTICLCVRGVSFVHIYFIVHIQFKDLSLFSRINTYTAIIIYAYGLLSIWFKFLLLLLLQCLFCCLSSLLFFDRVVRMWHSFSSFF